MSKDIKCILFASLLAISLTACSDNKKSDDIAAKIIAVSNKLDSISYAAKGMTLDSVSFYDQNFDTINMNDMCKDEKVLLLKFSNLGCEQCNKDFLDLFLSLQASEKYNTPQKLDR